MLGLVRGGHLGAQGEPLAAVAAGADGAGAGKVGEGADEDADALAMVVVLDPEDVERHGIVGQGAGRLFDADALYAGVEL